MKRAYSGQANNFKRALGVTILTSKTKCHILYKRLRFSRTVVRDSTWHKGFGTNSSPFLLQLGDMAFTRLESFTLSWCEDGEEDLEVQDFMLRKAGVDPLVQERERYIDMMKENTEQRQQTTTSTILS